MVSKEFIRSIVRAHHTIAVYMKGENRIDDLSNLIYVIIDLIISEEDEKRLIANTINKIDTEGFIKIKAIRTSEIDISLQDSTPQEYTINTCDILKYEVIN